LSQSTQRPPAASNEVNTQGPVVSWVSVVLLNWARAFIMLILFEKRKRGGIIIMFIISLLFLNAVLVEVSTNYPHLTFSLALLRHTSVVTMSQLLLLFFSFCTYQ
jgi:hypothetical protein